MADGGYAQAAAERPIGTSGDGVRGSRGTRPTPGVRQSPEFQSGLVRLGAWLAMVVYIGVAGLLGHYPIDWTLYGLLFGIHLAWFTGLLAHVAYRPVLSVPRTYVAIAADLSAITMLIFLAGDPLAPFYLVYVLSFLSQGTRYGSRNLAVASIGSVISYGVVVTAMGAWQTHPFELAFVLLALVILPLYQYILLRNLQEARRAAEVAKKARGDFLATMTHELRTPLAGVTGMARLLAGSELDAEQRKQVSSISACAENLQALIGDILDLSKVDAGSLELHSAPFDLRQSLLEVCRNLSQPALDKGIELVCCIDPALPASCHGDRMRFEQILYNLIGNAVKFTPAGRICVEVERSPPRPGLEQHHLEVAIGDTGIGIPRERLDCVFDSFWQADTSASRRYGGTGLGTTIAHRLTAAMGGHIAVDSAENAGSTFRVRLPILPPPAEDRPPEPPATLAGRTALVHELDPEARSALEHCARYAGMNVVSCSDKDELGRRLDELGDPSAIEVAVVADAPQPLDLDAIMATLRARIGDHLAIVVATYGGRRQALEQHCTAVVDKPCHPAELWDALGAALATDQRAGADGCRAPLAAGEAAGARILVVEDDRINAELVDTLLTKWGYAAEVVDDSEAALRRTRHERFDVLLVDLRMPGMDGLELTRRVRARERESDGGHLPVVALTANTDPESRERGLAAGMDDFLAKPVDPDALSALIARLAPG